MKLITINTGEHPNDRTGDTFKDGFDKVNHNFDIISKRMNIKFEFVVWKSIEDTQKAFQTINKNFNLIKI